MPHLASWFRRKPSNPAAAAAAAGHTSNGATTAAPPRSRSRWLKWPILTIALLIVLGFYSWRQFGSATPMDAKAFVPSTSLKDVIF